MAQAASAITTLITYTVQEEALGAIQTVVQRLVAKADRAGTAEVRVEATPIEGRRDGGRLCRLRVVASSVPRIGGFELVGKVLHSRGEPNVVLDFGGAGLAERFSEAPPNCGHCGRARRRVETFLLRGVAGDVRQVGRNCLRDYATGTGQIELKAALGAADLLAELSGALRQWDEPTELLLLPRYLELVAEALMRDGWVSAGQSRKTGELSTAEQALRLLEAQPATKPRSAACGLAHQALLWVRALPIQDHEYLDSVRRVCSSDLIERWGAGLAASVLWAYRSRHHLPVALPTEGDGQPEPTRWDADEYQMLVGALNPSLETAGHWEIRLQLCQAIVDAAAELVERTDAAEGRDDREDAEAETQIAGEIALYLASYLGASGTRLSEALEDSVRRRVPPGGQVPGVVTSPAWRGQAG